MESLIFNGYVTLKRGKYYSFEVRLIKNIPGLIGAVFSTSGLATLV